MKNPYQYFGMVFLIAIICSLLLNPTLQIFCDPEGVASTTQQGTISGSTYNGGTNTATAEGNRGNLLFSFGNMQAEVNDKESINTMCSTLNQRYWVSIFLKKYEICSQVMEGDKKGMTTCLNQMHDSLTNYNDNCGEKRK